MEVEKRLSIIYSKIQENTHTKKDQLMLAFLDMFYHKRTEAYFKEYTDQDLKDRINAGLRKMEEDRKMPIPKFKSGDEVYLILKEHDDKPYVINSIHMHRDKLIGYTFLNENKVPSGHIYPEALFVHRNIGRLDSDNTSYEKFISDLKSKYESWA